MAVTETPPETVDAAASPAPSESRTQPSGLAAVVGSGDHKVVGRLYIATSLILGLDMLLLGGLFAFESTDTETLSVFSSGSVFQYFTLYRVGAVFALAFPLVIGVAMVVVPLQVGARTVAFPRAAAASYWSWLVGALLLVASYLMDGGPGGGNGEGVNLWIVSMGILTVAILLAAVSLATTVIALRAPGMSLSRVPLYSWSVAVAAVMWLLTLPVLFAGLVLAYVDNRHAGGVLGGNAALYPQVGWMLRNPQIYVIAIPVLGFAADVLATTARARIPMRSVAIGSIVSMGIVSFGAVLATTDPTAVETPVMIALALVAAIPVLGIIGLCADLFRQGSFRLTTGALYAVSATLILLVATVAGAIGSIPALELTGTIFDLGTYHAAILAALTASLGGIHWWATKIGRQPATEAIGRSAALLLLLGSLNIVLSGVIAGLIGEDLELSPDWTGGIEGLNFLALAGTVLVTLGVIAALISFLPLVKKASQVERNPWDGQTLEWLAPSPPPLGNFDSDLPVVTSAEPLTDSRKEK